VVFGPDGTRVATALQGSGQGGIGSVRVIDVATGVEISRLDHDLPVYAVVFGPDGTRVATASHSVDHVGSSRVSYADHTLLIEQALGRLTRNLTRQEWSSYFHGAPYRKTRADLP
jgi:WD40 repeat protein